MTKFRILVGVPASVLLLLTVLAAAGMRPDEDTGVAGWVGAAIFAIAGIAGLAAALKSGSAPVRRSARAAVVLPFAMSLLACAVGIGAGASADVENAYMLVGGGAILILCVLMLLGLSGMGRAARASDPGTAAAVTGFRESGLLWHGLAAIAIVGGLGSIISGVLRVPRGPATAGAQDLVVVGDTSAPRSRRFEESNFLFRVPGRPWVEINAAELNADTAFAMFRNSPQVAFQIIPEHVGESAGATAELLAEFARANVVSAAASASLVNDRAYSAGGIPGRRLSLDVTLKNQPLRYVIWTGVANGYAYQILVWGSVYHAEAVERNADQVYSWFDLIDAPETRVAQGEVLRCDLTGVRLSLAGTEWTPWKNLAMDIPDAAFGAVQGRTAAIAVVPVRLFGLDPQPDALASALLERLEFQYPGPDVQPVGAVSLGSATGREFAGTRRVGSQAYDYRLRVLRDGDIAFLIAARTKQGASEGLGAILDRVEFAPPSQTSPDPADFSAAVRSRHAFVFSGMALFAYTNAQYNRALDGFLRASEFAPRDPMLLTNAFMALEHVEEAAPMLDVLRERLEAFPSNYDLRSRWAALLSRTGDAAGARAEYADLFSDGFRDQRALADYVGLLVEAKDADGAEQAVKRYGGRQPSRALRAQVLKARGDEEGAIAVLRGALVAKPLDAEGAFALLGVALESDHHTDAIEACTALAEAGYASGEVYAFRGDAEMALGRVADARASYEAAVKADPTNPRLREGLGVLVTMLGEGDTSAVRTPVDPVMLPAGLLAADDEEADDTTTGAVYEAQVTAIRFVPGDVHRSTEYIRARVIDRRGLDALGTFRFDFDPTHERLFVNRLEVRDEDGNVVSTGNVSEYYVLDAADDEAASQDRVLNIPVRSLAPGRTVELIITRDDLSAPEELPFQRHVFQGLSPVRRSAVVLFTDQSAAGYRATPDVSVAPTQGGVVFTLDDQSAWAWEPLDPPALSYLPSVTLFSPGSTWEEEARSYLELIRERLESDAAVEKLAARLVGPADAAEHKVAAIVRHVQSEYAYRAIAFGPRAAVPSPAARVIADRFGDCKDHSLLAHLLLRAAGVQSHLALVSAEGWTDERIPSRQQFDHMVVYLPDGKGGGRFLDLTDKDTDVLAPVPVGLSGAKALVLDQSNPRLVTIPELPAGSADLRCDRTLTVEGGALLAREKVTASGYAAALLRSLVRAQGADRGAAALRPVLSSAEPNVQIVSATFRGIEDTASDVEIELSYRLPGRVIRLGEDRAVTPPCIWERVMVPAEPVLQRQSPFRIEYPIRIRVETVLRAEGEGPLPERLADRTEGCAVFYSAAREDGAVRILTSLEARPGTYPAERYTDYTDVVGEVLAAAQSPIPIGQDE